MKKYKYKAKKGPTDVVEGILIADSQDEAIDKVNALGLLPIEVNEEITEVQIRKSIRASFFPKKIKGREFNSFYRQFARLIKSGIPILRALDFAYDQSESIALKEILGNVQKKVRDGESLSSAFASQQRIFSPFDIALIQAGESVGRLDESLLKIAEYRETQQELISKVKSALAYPIFIAVTGFASITFMLAYVIPQFTRFFIDLGQELPLATKILIALSVWIKSSLWWVIIVSSVICLLIARSMKSKAQKMIVDKFALSIPKIGDLIIKLEIAKFSRTIALLLKSRMQLLQAIKVAIPIVKNDYIRSELNQCLQLLQEGGRMSDAIKNTKEFPSFFIQLVRVGEEAGRLDETFSEIADWYEKDTNETIKVTTALLEPTMILIMGLIMGLIVIAILLPVFSMNTMIQ